MKNFKEESQDLKENYSLNNWIRVLDTSGMSVVDRLILDNHRRQILKNLSANERTTGDSFDQKDSKNSSKLRSKPFSTFQNSNQSSFVEDSIKQKIPFRTLNDSFATIESRDSKSACAERLYNDAIIRKIKNKRLQEEKEIIDIENAVDFANLHHPKRKPDPEIFARLIQEEKIIKNSYDMPPEPELSQTRSRRFSCAEQQASLERLTRTKGKSLSKNDPNYSIRKLIPNEIDELVKRLYKVKKYNEPIQRKKLLRKNKKKSLKNDIEFDGKLTSDLKTSKRYDENNGKLFNNSNESIIEFSSDGNASKNEGFDEETKLLYIASPKSKFNNIEIEHHLEVKLLNFDAYDTSTIVSEVIRGSPENNFDCPIVDSSFVSYTTSVTKEVKNGMSPDESVIEFSREKNFIEEMDSLKIQIEASSLQKSDENIEKNEFVKQECKILLENNKETEENNKKIEEKSNETTNSNEKSEEKHLNGINKIENSYKNLLIPKSLYLEPEVISSRGQSTNYSQESLYLMQNPLQSLSSNKHTPKASYNCGLDSYRFIVGITEDDEYIYAD